jgi:hypothetical protein
MALSRRNRENFKAESFFHPDFLLLQGWRKSIAQTTPSSRNRLTSAGATPHSSLSNPSVCSPTSGGRLTSTGETGQLDQATSA